MTGEPPESDDPVVSDGALLGLLVLDGVLLGGFGLVFTPLYTNGVPVPMGAVLSILILPWLVLRAGEVDARPAAAGAPLTAWALTVGVLGLAGPGGDVLLPATWQSLLLLAGGLGAGLLTLRTVLNREYARHG
jgi:hypothetical protein